MPERIVKVTEMVGAFEIAQRLHVEPNTVHSWLRRYDTFPEPVAKLHSAWVWAWPDVEAWAKATGRK